MGKQDNYSKVVMPSFASDIINNNKPSSKAKKVVKIV